MPLQPTEEKILVLIQAALLLVAVSAHASDEGGQAHYCNDPTADADCERIIANSDDPEPQQLNNLRLRLCDRIRAGEIPVDAAIRQFKGARIGQSVEIPAKYVAHFKPGKGLRERVDS